MWTWTYLLGAICYPTQWSVSRGLDPSNDGKLITSWVGSVRVQTGLIILKFLTWVELKLHSTGTSTHWP